jgi:hypothetical protein
MPAKRKVKGRQKANGNPQRTSSQRNRVQQTVHNGQRELDHREYDPRYEKGGKEALRNQKPAADQGADEGRSDTVESPLKAGLKLYPPVPPPALFEAAELIEAATTFWGLKKNDLISKSKQPEICWPRFVCCWILRQKGLSDTAIGKVLKRGHTTIANAVKQFNALTEVYPAYKQQAKAFDRYCWNTVGQLPTKRYKAGVGRP